MSYAAPVNDMLFCMTELADLRAIAACPASRSRQSTIAQAVLEECARFSEGVLAPLNVHGDQRRRGGTTGGRRRPGSEEADRQFGEGGWQGLQHPPEYGGQGLPKTIAPLHRDAQQRQPELRLCPC